MVAATDLTAQRRKHHHHHHHGAQPSITVNGLTDGAIVNPGAPLTLVAVRGPANRADWVGIAPAGQDPSVDIPDYAYLVTGTSDRPPMSASGVPGATITSLSAPTMPGNYEARFYADDGIARDWLIADAPFIVELS